MEKKIMLAKFFERAQEEDFSDDGNFFRCYKLGDDIRISISRDRGETYLDAHFDNLIDNDIWDLDVDYAALCRKAGEAAGRYNGTSREITNEDLAVWKDDLEYYRDLLKNYTLPKPIIYLNPLDNQYYAFQYRKNYSWGDVEKKLDRVYISNTNKHKFTIKYLKVVDNLD